MRVLGVIRLSRETDESTSPQRQRQGLEAWALAHGHTIVGWAEDLDVSGDVSPWERPELGRWLGESPPAPFDIIAGMKIDRLSRNLLHFVGLIDWAAERGMHVAAYKDNVDTSHTTGAMIAKVLALFAEFERKTIAERSAASREELRQLGRWHGGTVPYGYQPVKNPDGAGWILAHDPETLPVFREIVARVIDGKSIASIAEDLEKRGVLSPRDHAAKRDGKVRKDKGGLSRPPQRWTDQTIRRMLISRAPLGQLDSKGSVVRDRSSGLPIQRAEPLISEVDWKAVQAAIDGKKRPKYRAAPDSLLSGLAFCGEDGHPMHYHWMAKPGKKVYQYYRCAGRTKFKLKCPAKAATVEVLDKMVTDAFLTLVGDLEVMEKRLIPGEDHSVELEQVKQAMRELEDDRMAGLYSTEDGKNSYRRMYLALSERREKLAGLPNVPDRWEDVPTGIRFRELWHSLETTAERRKFLLDSGIKVHVYAEPKDLPDYDPTFPHGGPGHIPIEIRPDLLKRVMDRATQSLAEPGAKLSFAMNPAAE